MRHKTICYILPEFALFNPDKIKIFESFDNEHSALLWRSLYFNAVEVISQSSNNTVMVFDELDRDYLPDGLKNGQCLFGDISNSEALFRKLNERYFNEAENNILFLFNSIGYTNQDLQKAVNLLNINDDALVLAKSSSDKLCYAGFNKYDNFLDFGFTEYADVLAHSCRAENYIFTLDNYLSINELADFRKLYTELSKKESIAYCSRELHEQFTHLFIEYKDLLK